MSLIEGMIVQLAFLRSTNMWKKNLNLFALHCVLYVIGILIVYPSWSQSAWACWLFEGEEKVNISSADKVIKYDFP